MYGDMQMPPDYAMVTVTWTNPVYEDDELNFPTVNGVRLLRGAISEEVLWNKDDILLEMKTPLSQPTPSTAVDDDDDNSGGGNDDPMRGQQRASQHRLQVI